MDSTEMTVDLGQPEESEDLRVVEIGTIKEVGEMLEKLTSGVLVIDHDFTLKPKEFELWIGRKEPGRLPDESIKLLKSLKNAGWEILVVSNQPREGHQVARWIRGMKKGSYPIFPGSVTEILGKEGVEGGGWDFLWKKYKSTPEAVDSTAKWIEKNLKAVPGQIYFVGDRDSDVEFARNVERKLREVGVLQVVNILKVRGLDLPKVLKPLERFIP